MAVSALAAATVAACGGPRKGGRGTDAGSQGDAGPPDAGPSCAAGPCFLATALNHPWALATDGAYLYFTEFGDGTGATNGSVKRCAIADDCAAGPTVLASGLSNPQHVVVDANNVYFADLGTDTVGAAISSCALTGCGTRPTSLSSAGSPACIASDGTYIYWVDGQDDSVNRVPLAGGPRSVVYNGMSLVFAEPQDCRVDASNVYVSDANEDVFLVPLAGGEPTKIAAGSGVTGFAPLALGAADLFLGRSGSLVRVPFGQTGGATLATGIPSPSWLAFDDTTATLYWSNRGSGSAGDGSLGKVVVGGAGQTNLATGLTTPQSLVVTGSAVYWLSYGTLAGNNGTDTMPRTGALGRVPL